MNRLEQIVHSQVADHPRLRVPLVAAYQRLLSLIPARTYMASVPMRSRAGSFFGFHDKCPWSVDGEMILTHSFDTAADLEAVESAPIEIGVLQSDSMEYRRLGSTSTWNWQQGAMLQWVGKSDLLLYNDHVDGRNISRIVNAEAREEFRFPLHLANVSPDGRCAVSYSFERMHNAAPEYSYRVGEYSSGDVGLPNREGLRLVDLQTGDVRTLFGLREVAEVQPEKSMSDAYHYFTHGLFSPDGSRLAFFHRWVDSRGVLNTRLFSTGLDGTGLHLFNVTHASHVCWRDHDWILAYCRPEGCPIGYYLLRDSHQEHRSFCDWFPAGDGHPQFSEDGTRVVTDTYPDRSRIQSLLVHDTLTHETRLLAALRISFEYRYARRCDFHPRWDRDGEQICFDSAHSGTRSMVVMDVAQFRDLEDREQCSMPGKRWR